MRMLKRGIVLALFWAALLTLPAPSMCAQWIEDGSAVCTFGNEQEYPTIASDGAGGAIVAWRDYRNGTSYDIYAQRVDSYGAVQWTVDGVALCTAATDQEYPAIVSDGAGGAIVTWYDHRSGNADIYAQRVDSYGAVQWTTDGVALCAAALNQQHPTIVSDGAGGAIVTWSDFRSGSSWDIYAQRVNSAGAIQWTADGEALCTATETQTYPTIVSDGAGGAIVTWHDYRSGNADIYARHVSASGWVQWTVDGVSLCTATGNQLYPTIASDGTGGAIVTWYDYRSGSNWDIYAQRVDDSGTIQWTSGGITVCTATGSQQSSTIVSDGAGGAIVTWHDYRSGNADIYAQRVDATGADQWTTDGVALCSAASSQNFPKIVPDGAEGAIVTWNDYRNGQIDIYAQRVGASGAVLWTTDGVGLSTVLNDQEIPAIVSDGAEGAIVAWQDYRSSYGDIYAQRVLGRGGRGYEVPYIRSISDVPNDQGGKVSVEWERSGLDSPPNTTITHYSVWRSISATASLMASDIGELWPGGLRDDGPEPTYRVASVSGVSYAWEWLADLPAHYFEDYSYTADTLFDSTSASAAHHYFLVSAHTSDPFVFLDSAPDSGYSVDNLPPSPPAALVAEYVGGFQLHIRWNANMEADLSHYAVYKGTTPDFIPNETNRVGTATSSSFVDDDFDYGEHYYKVSAWDIHENESPFSLLIPDMIADTPDVGRDYANVLFQNAPNPFPSSTSIAFSIKEAGHVSLVVFDAKGRLVRVLADEVREANRYVEVWDARDDNGRLVPAGTYFYSLDAPGWKASKKMTLAR
jgi:hypothetical protein